MSRGSFLYALVFCLKRPGRPKTNQHSLEPNDAKSGPHQPKPTSNQPAPGFFNQAENFGIYKSTLIENRGQIINNTVLGKPVLERLAPCTNLDVADDPVARLPPSTCHPQTRLQIRSDLAEWVSGPGREWKLTWLHGPAGTGKSAVAQAFAEQCSQSGHLVASFFSRPNHHNDPNSVIPTLTYQLAQSLPGYNSILNDQFANDPLLLRRALRIQLKKLIVEPFSRLHSQGHLRVQKPFLIIIDGLDECEGEDTQSEIAEMICEAVQQKQDLPLLWLICSRAEPHLNYIFSRSHPTPYCHGLELLVDARSRADVDLYLYDGFARIKEKLSDVTTSTWPSKEQFTELSLTASGLFIFASTALKYIGDPKHAAPMDRLEALLLFLRGTKRDGVKNPLEAVDLLYTKILDGVPEAFLSVAGRILSYFIYLSGDLMGQRLSSVQGLCNFFSIDKGTFYGALRRLRSVIDLPPPELASTKRLRFYHSSFEGYLCSAKHPSRFVLDKKESIFLAFAKSCLSWYGIDLALFQTSGGLELNRLHDHGILPGLKWVSAENKQEISGEIARLAETKCWAACNMVDEWDEDLLSLIQEFDFRYIRTDHLDHDWRRFVNKLWEVASSSGIIRTEPGNEVDFQLLEYVRAVTNSGGPIRPATFPLKPVTQKRRDSRLSEYFLIGNSSKASLCLLSFARAKFRVDILNCDQGFSEKRLDAYRGWLADIGWFVVDNSEEREIEEERRMMDG